MRIALPARLEAEGKKHPGLIPAVGVGATIIAAYAGIAALRRGASSGAAAGPTPFPALNDLASGLGLDSGPPPFQPTGVGASPLVGPGGGGYDPIAPVLNVGTPPGTISQALATLPTSPRGIVSGTTGRIPVASSPAPAPTGTIGGSRGGVVVTRQGDVAPSHLASTPGTPAPAGHVTSQQVIRRVGSATATAPAAHVTSQQVIRRVGSATATAPAPAGHVTSQQVIRRVGSATAPAKPHRVAAATWDAAHHPAQAAASYASQARLVRAI